MRHSRLNAPLIKGGHRLGRSKWMTAQWMFAIQELISLEPTPLSQVIVFALALRIEFRASELNISLIKSGAQIRALRIFPLLRVEPH